MLDFGCGLGKLARCGGGGSRTAGDLELATQFIADIRQMNREMGIPDKVGDLRREDFQKIVRRAFREAHESYDVPWYFSRAECEEVLRQPPPAS